MNFLKILTVFVVLLGSSAFARQFTTYGRGEGRDYYGNRYAACDQAQRAAHYYAVQSCRSRYGVVTSAGVSACSCVYQMMHGYHGVLCVADARAACDVRGGYYPPPQNPGYGYPRDPGYGYPREPGRPGHGRGGYDDGYRGGHR